jgi:hypothetical protein
MRRHLESLKETAIARQFGRDVDAEIAAYARAGMSDDEIQAQLPLVPLERIVDARKRAKRPPA